MTALPKPKYTVEEYIELLKNADERFEYFAGEIVSMAGGKIAHGAITSNLIFSLMRGLEGRGCQVLGGDVAVKTVKAPPFRLPDVSVVCGELRSEELFGIEALLNPVLIVEVLSPTTAAYDREEKFLVYQAIESFQEYLLVEQDRPHVTRYVRQPDGQWLRGDFIGLESVTLLDSLGLVLPLSDIYRAINFASQPDLGAAETNS